MEKISRKGFLKVAAAAAMSGVTAGALTACNSASSSGTAASASGDAVYTPGTYTGTATGIGEVKVTMTFSETAITDVVIDASNETESIGGVAAPTLQDAIMAAQNAEIDNVSGATVTTNAVKKAAASCIEQAMGVASEEPAASSFPFSCVRHTTHLFYHELRNYAIDACTKKCSGFSERVCIDTFNSARKERAAYTGTVQIRKGLGFPNKHFATQNLHLCARMHCLPQWCWF